MVMEVVLMAMLLVLMLMKMAVSELRVTVRRGGVARVLAVEPEPDGRRVVVMVVLIGRRILWKRTVLGTLGLEVGLGGVVQVGGVGLVGDEGGVDRAV